MRKNKRLVKFEKGGRSMRMESTKNESRQLSDLFTDQIYNVETNL